MPAYHLSITSYMPRHGKLSTVHFPFRAAQPEEVYALELLHSALSLSDRLATIRYLPRKWLLQLSSIVMAPHGPAMPALCCPVPALCCQLITLRYQLQMDLHGPATDPSLCLACYSRLWDRKKTSQRPATKRNTGERTKTHLRDEPFNLILSVFGLFHSPSPCKQHLTNMLPWNI